MNMPNYTRTGYSAIHNMTRKDSDQKIRSASVEGMSNIITRYDHPDVGYRIENYAEAKMAKGDKIRGMPPVHNHVGGCHVGVPSIKLKRSY